MADADQERTDGVQRLIDRIRGEAVAAGRTEAAEASAASP